MTRTGREDGMLKVHSLGYMEEKLKSIVKDCEKRYILNCTTFIRVCAIYAPSGTCDERIMHIEEMIQCSAGIEGLIHTINDQSRTTQFGEHSTLVVSREIAEARRILSAKRSNPNSGFYGQLRRLLCQYTGSTPSVQFRNRARDIGKAIRTSVRPTFAYMPEQKAYIRDAQDIDQTLPLIITIDKEYDKVHGAIARI